MAIKYFVKAAVSEYQDQAGANKKRYQTIGIVMETKHGLMLKIESLPLFAMKEGSILAYLNDPEEKDSKQAAPAPTESAPDDIPF